MSLIEIWKENRDQIREKRVDQIIGFAGDGKLRDKSSAPDEFRAFLTRVPVAMLERYAEECLSKAFTEAASFGLLRYFLYLATSLSHEFILAV